MGAANYELQIRMNSIAKMSTTSPNSTEMVRISLVNNFEVLIYFPLAPSKISWLTWCTTCCEIQTVISERFFQRNEKTLYFMQHSLHMSRILQSVMRHGLHWEWRKTAPIWCLPVFWGKMEHLGHATCMSKHSWGLLTQWCLTTTIWLQYEDTMWGSKVL